MEEVLIPIFAIFAIFIACPGMILYYLLKRREQAGDAKPDPKMANDMLRIAEKLEARVQSLETILDSEVPGWRKNLEGRDH